MMTFRVTLWVQDRYDIKSTIDSANMLDGFRINDYIDYIRYVFSWSMMKMT